MSAPVWMPVLRQELALFPQALVISLGQPVLTMLIHHHDRRDVKYYWGYHARWKTGKRESMHPVTAKASLIGRSFHPFIHQPSWISPRAQFYRDTWDAYLDFVRQFMVAASNRSLKQPLCASS